jgi:predicted AlkP superfamily phosphohydrolase/phosphomutase
MVALTACSLSPAPPTSSKRVIVIGADGMDPNFLERHWDGLPNLNKLRTQGSFRRLTTTTPPQSPVAWSTFITGTDPSAHRIFDFVHRNPATLQPYSSLSKTEDSAFAVPLGPYLFPLSKAGIATLRRGTTFWEVLSQHQVPVSVIHMPTNYPPVKVGRAIAGMGVPDLPGTLGTFTFYTDDPEEISRSVPGGRIVRIPSAGGRIALSVEGPPNPLRRDHRISSIELTVDVDPVDKVARLETGDSMAIVQQAEWSPWLIGDFPLLGSMATVRGMFRVYAKQLHPRLELYVSPVNADPAKPDLPISFPATFTREMAREAGAFYTLGIAEDTSALRQGVFNLKEYLAQSRLVLADEIKLLRSSLRHFEGGLLFFYFSSIDQNSHVLWGQHEGELMATYRAIDAAIGEVIEGQPRADLIVLSDHGFTTFDRAFHLNAWLRQQGYLTLKSEPGAGGEVLAGVDWSRTRLYALGLNGLYVNLAGREKYGVVKPGVDSEALVDEVSRVMKEYRDPANGRAVVRTLSASQRGADALAPDLIVGYAPGYRASWQTALGAVPSEIIVDNNDAWIGDHCINAADVPGVLLTNRSTRIQNPQLKDVTLSVLAAFGVSPGTGMDGKALF